MPLASDDMSILEIARFALLLITPIILILTFRRNSSITTLTMCHTLGERHMELMWFTTENEILNGVWDPIPPERLAELEEGQKTGVWGAWRMMTQEGRARYRFARRALEHIEQAYEIHSHRWMPTNLWDTWQSRMRAWKRSNYTRFVLADLAEFKSSKFFRDMTS
jgi:hypothetical protein